MADVIRKHVSIFEDVSPELFAHIKGVAGRQQASAIVGLAVDGLRWRNGVYSNTHPMPGVPKETQAGEAGNVESVGIKRCSDIEEAVSDAKSFGL
ncbi:MAG: hypothetical protein C9356_12260 [Oleiphilus sp.]|nr:MAG: hypothetical protein C9356_12260 [Oleiphilus sp.]